MMHVTRCGSVPEDDLRRLFVDHRFGRYCADRKLDPVAARRLECDRLAQALAKSDSVNWIVADDHRLVGVLRVEESRWDTEFWGKKAIGVEDLVICGTDEERERAAEALVDVADRWCREAGAVLAVARPDSTDLASIGALENHGFRFVETTLANSRDLATLPPVNSSEGLIRPARPDETEALVDMVKDAFVTHRFYADRRFPLDRVEEMYRRWVRHSLQSEMWTTIVLEVSGRARGLFTYRFEDLTEYFGLRFVKWRMATLGPEDRGRGFGERLFRGAMDFVRDRADVVDSGVTMRNTRSLNLHNRLGFRVLYTAVTLHKWFA